MNTTENQSGAKVEDTYSENENPSGLTLKGRLARTFFTAKDAVVAAVESENTRAALDWTKKTGAEIVDHAVDLGKEALHSEVGQAAAKGAAVGAVAAIPIPLVGPLAGAITGAGVGAILQFRYGKNAPSDGSETRNQETTGDVITDLTNLAA